MIKTSKVDSIKILLILIIYYYNFGRLLMAYKTINNKPLHNKIPGLAKEAKVGS